MTDSDKADRRAACSCGRLSLSARGEPVRISICHCLACQRRTGSVFAVQARFPEGDVRIDGESSTYTRVGDSGSKISFHFCPDCGSTVYFRLERFPELIAVPVGAFADAGFPAPKISVYESRRHTWVHVPATAERFDD